MGKSKFYIKLVDKDNAVYYLSHVENKEELMCGIMVSYVDYVITQNINKAYEFVDEASASRFINIMKSKRPTWMNQYNTSVWHKMGDKEFISVNTRPFVTILKLIRGYKEASQEGREKIMDKLFDNDDLYNACDFALNELNKLKK